MFFEERCSLDNWDVFVHLHAVLCGMQKVVLIFLHLKWFKLILIVVNYCQKNSRRFSYLILLSHYSETTSSTTSFWYQRKFSCCFSSKLISQNANLQFSCQMKRNLTIKNIFSVILSQLHYLRNETIRPHGSPDQQFLAIQI